MKKEKSLFQDLWDRKVPQYLGTYFAIGFGLLQFLEFLTNRFDLSSVLVYKYFLVWLTLVPAITILSYFGDQLNPKTVSGIARWPKFIVAGNIMLSLILAIFFFNEPNDGEQVKVVTVTNEEGEEIKTSIPTLKKIKTIAVFQFDNRTNDEKEDWWGIAFSNLLQFALEQRPEFYIQSQYNLESYYNALGIESFTLPNVAIQREIAQKSRNDYFTRISYKKSGSNFVFSGSVYSAKNGKDLFSLKAENDNPFLAIDALKNQIYDKIPNALNLDKNQIVLPSSSLITNNIESLEELTNAIVIYFKDPNGGLESAVEKARKSIILDESCSLCNLTLGYLLVTQGNKDGGLEFYKKAVKYGSSLPKRLQFQAKRELYTMTNNTDAYIKLLELQRKLFPYSFDSYEQLLHVYETNYGVDSAQVLMREAIANGNIERGLLELYNLQVENEEYLEAEKTLDEYSSKFPDRKQDQMKYADIYERQGKIEKAKEILEKEELINPFNPLVQRRLAYLDFINQDINAAFKRIDNALIQASTLSDSLSYLKVKSNFYRMCGQVENALLTLTQYQKSAEKKRSQSQILLENVLIKGDLYYSIGKIQQVDAVLDRIRSFSSQDIMAYRCSIDERALLRYGGEIIREKRFMPCENLRKQLGDGYENYFNFINAYRKGDFERCYDFLVKDDGKLKKLFLGREFILAKVYFMNGDSKVAKQILMKRIKQKTDEPICYYEMAVVLENENKSEAIDYLNIAMKYWANADEDYIPLKRAKILAERLLVLNSEKS